MKSALLAIALVALGSIHAAKTSQIEVVSFYNDDKQFSCNGRNVEWYFPNNTKIVQSSEKFQIENPSENESILTVKKINGASIGVYKCHSLIDDVEKDFYLKLYYPLAINNWNRQQSVQENGNITLKCKTISIPSVEKITWYHGDRELVPDVDYKLEKDGIFLQNVQPENSGEYTCVAIQKLGSLQNIQQRDMELIVEYGPRQIENQASVIYAKIGETQHLNCEAKCEPSPIFTWLINGYETFENVHIRDYTSTLEVKINSENDFQTYTCLASNIHGQSNQTFVLRERVESENTSSKTSSKTAGVILYTLSLIISMFLIY